MASKESNYVFMAYKTTFIIPIPKEDFINISDNERDRDDDDRDDNRCLYEILDAIDGVQETDYNGHFGSNIYLDIETEYDTPKLRKKILSCIRDYVLTSIKESV